MRTIHIDEDVWRAIRTRAAGSEETPNSVLRRVLSLDKKATEKPRDRATERTPEDAYRRPILEALIDMGGSGVAAEVLDQVAEKMKDIFTPVDYQRMSSGEVRWRNMAQWARYRMAQGGLLRSHTRPGYWEITEAGRRHLELELSATDNGH